VLLHPSYRLQVGSETIDPVNTDDLVSLRVSLGMSNRADSLQSVLRIRDGGFKFARNDTASLSLGYKDSLTNVYTGTVDNVTMDFYSAKVMALTSIARLLRMRTNRFYENQSCGAIVSDLTSSAGLSADTIQDGIQLPYYTVDSHKSAFEHMLELAGRCGFDVFATPEDKLAFKKYESSTPKPFEYGKNIISVRRFDQEPLFKSVRVFGESPSSSKGADTAHWLTKRQVQGMSGSGSEFVIQDRTVRDTAAASSVASERLDSLTKAIVVELEVVGDATVMLDDTAKIDKMPDEKLNGEYQVRGVEHSLSKGHGFTTSLNLRGGPVSP
jgi:phage protein D